MAIENYYVSCSRLRPTETLNSRLVPVKTYASTTINGYLGSGNDVNITIADKDTIETRYKFYCDDFSIDTGDLINYESNTYEVISEPKNTAHRNNHIKVLVRKIDKIKQE